VQAYPEQVLQIQNVMAEIAILQGNIIHYSGTLKSCIKRAKKQFYNGQLECMADSKLWNTVE
jgi:hypothetical protein